jgi:hypothetical protein
MRPWTTLQPVICSWFFSLASSVLADFPRYLLINYRLAELVQRVAQKDRLSLLAKAREAYERYLLQLDQYEILSSDEKKLYQRYTESPTTFTTISTTDPAARRGAKIANFKREKELKQKLEVGNKAYQDITFTDNSSYCHRTLRIFSTTMTPSENSSSPISPSILMRPSSL